MGNRVSIQFQLGENKSVCVFSHWRGMEFVEFANTYAERLKAKSGDKMLTPLDRLEPETVVTDFILQLADHYDLKKISSGFYIVPTENDGDNSDNGHHIIQLKKEVLK